MGSSTDSFVMRHKPKIQSLLGNFYLDYFLNYKWTLYLSTGMGINFNNALIIYREREDKGNWSASSRMFAWQVGSGFSYSILENFTFDLNVRYIDFGKTSFKPSSLPAVYSVPVGAIEVLAGLNYRF